MTTINIPCFLQYFDTLDSKGHASALMGMFGEELISGLLQHYLLQERHRAVEVIYKDGKPACPSLGVKGSKQLDRWLLAHGDHADRMDDSVKLYQVEIKSWSATTKDGKAVTSNRHADIVGSENWTRHFRIDRESEVNAGSFIFQGVEKVLIRMRPPKSCYVIDPESGEEFHQTLALDQVVISPVIAFWEPIVIDGNTIEINNERMGHPLIRKAQINPTDELMSSIRKCDPDGKPFNSVEVFSASNYLRLQLANGISKLLIAMPHYRDRHDRLEVLFS